MISTTSQLIALVESNNNPTALRFEPLWRYVTPELILQCQRSHTAYMNDATARALLMFSYGKYQIMGSVLYEIGYKGTLLDFQNSTTLQDAWFQQYLKSRKIDFSLNELINWPANRNQFAWKYNGATEAYAAKLVSVMKANGIKVVE